MTDTLDAAGETYSDSRPVIGKIVNAFAEVYNLDREELIQEAALSFVRAYQSWDIYRGDFVKRLTARVQGDLKRVAATERKRRAMFPRSEVDPDALPAQGAQGAFDLTEFVCRLSDDAAFVVRLVVETPPGLRREVAKRGLPSGGNYRITVGKHLRRLGWKTVRIKDTFKEIRSRL